MMDIGYMHPLSTLKTRVQVRKGLVEPGGTHRIAVRLAYVRREVRLMTKEARREIHHIRPAMQHLDESSLFGLPNGLAPAPTGFFGLGLGFECRSKPKPADRLGKPICRLGKPVCSLNRETGLCVFLVPVGLISQSKCIDYV